MKNLGYAFATAVMTSVGAATAGFASYLLNNQNEYDGSVTAFWFSLFAASVSTFFVTKRAGNAISPTIGGLTGIGLSALPLWMVANAL